MYLQRDNVFINAIMPCTEIIVNITFIFIMSLTKDFIFVNFIYLTLSIPSSSSSFSFLSSLLQQKKQNKKTIAYFFDLPPIPAFLCASDLIYDKILAHPVKQICLFSHYPLDLL